MLCLSQQDKIWFKVVLSVIIGKFVQACLNLEIPGSTSCLGRVGLIHPSLFFFLRQLKQDYPITHPNFFSVTPLFHRNRPIKARKEGSLLLRGTRPGFGQSGLFSCSQHWLVVGPGAGYLTALCPSMWSSSSLGQW